MNFTQLPIESLIAAPWNSNQTDEVMMERLKNSLGLFGNVLNLVCRPLGNGTYEVLGGNQRLKILREAEEKMIPCAVLNLDDAQAKLLAQALNHVHGKDDLGLRAELMKQVLKYIPESQIMAILPETATSLNSLSKMGTEDIATHLTNWSQVQAAKLRQIHFRLTREQKDVIEKALSQVMPLAKKNQADSPNARGTALYLLCKEYLEKETSHGK